MLLLAWPRLLANFASSRFLSASQPRCRRTDGGFLDPSESVSWESNSSFSFCRCSIEALVLGSVLSGEEETGGVVWFEVLNRTMRKSSPTSAKATWLELMVQQIPTWAKVRPSRETCIRDISLSLSPGLTSHLCASRY